MKTRENTHKVKVEFPEVRKILQKLYKSAYNSGYSEDGDDNYDFSSAYNEIETLINDNFVAKKDLKDMVTLKFNCNMDKVLQEITQDIFDSTVDDLIKIGIKIWK